MQRNSRAVTMTPSQRRRRRRCGTSGGAVRVRAAVKRLSRSRPDSSLLLAGCTSPPWHCPSVAWFSKNEPPPPEIFNLNFNLTLGAHIRNCVAAHTHHKSASTRTHESFAGFKLFPFGLQSSRKLASCWSEEIARRKSLEANGERVHDAFAVRSRERARSPEQQVARRRRPSPRAREEESRSLLSARTNERTSEQASEREREAPKRASNFLKFFSNELSTTNNKRQRHSGAS